MSVDDMQIICVVDPDDKSADECKRLAALWNDCRVINFYTTDMDELTLICKYRILPVPTILILHKNRTLARLIRPKFSDSIVDLINTTIAASIRK